MNPSKLAVGACLAAVVGLFVPTTMTRVSDFLMWILYLLAILPSMVIYGCQDRSTEYTIMLAASYIVVDVLRQPRFAFPRAPAGFDTAVVFFCGFIVVIAICS